MKAAVLEGKRDIRYKDVPRPEPGPGEVLARVEVVGICGTDMELYRGTMPFFEMGLAKYPMIMGHEWSGVVEQVGEGVGRLVPGDRVTGDVSIGCGRCVNCKLGLYSVCENRQEVGISGGKDGAFAEFIKMPEPFLYKVPENVSFDAAALTEPTATVVRSFQKTPIRLGDIVLVIGDGPIGLLGMQAARCGGAGFLIGAGQQQWKLDIARKLGADRVVNVCEEDLGPVVMDLTGGSGVDYLVEASGNPQAVAEASSLVKSGGTLNVIGIYETTIPDYDMADVVLRDISLIGTVASPNAYEGTIRLLASGRIKTGPCVSHHFALAEVDRAFEVQENSPAERLKVLLHP